MRFHSTERPRHGQVHRIENITLIIPSYLRAILAGDELVVFQERLDGCEDRVVIVGYPQICLFEPIGIGHRSVLVYKDELREVELSAASLSLRA